jgi:hypothetical protein
MEMLSGSAPILRFREAGKRRVGKMHEFDDEVLKIFLKNQLQLFPEKVAETLEEAESFLEECMAVVVDSLDEVIEFFAEEGIDTEGMKGEEILQAQEVFDIGDGRYLIVEG